MTGVTGTDTDNTGTDTGTSTAEVGADELGLGPLELNEATHAFLKALANPLRQRVMLLFARGAELSVGEVADAAGIGQSTASEQLALLRRGGVLASRRDGRVTLYRADRDRTRAALSDLQDYLDRCC